MNFQRGSRIFQPFFKLDRSEWSSKLLTVILLSAVLIEAGYIIARLSAGDGIFGKAVVIIFFLLLFHVPLFVPLRRGKIRATALALIFSTWIGMTGQAWVSGGVLDAAVTAYLLIILGSALIAEWLVSIVIAILSLLAIWGLTISQVQGVIRPVYDSPVSYAIELSAIICLLLVVVYLVVSMIGDSMSALRDEEQRFRRVFHVSPVAISLTSLKNGRLIEANDAYWKLMGFDPLTSIGRTTLELKIWRSEEERLEFVRKLIEHKSLHNPAYEFINQNGEKRITIAFYEWIDYAREPSILSMFYDVTSQQSIQSALRESEERYRNFIEQSIEGVWLLAFDEPIPVDLSPEEQVRRIYQYGYIAECNDALARMYGYESSRELQGVRLVDEKAGEIVDELNFQSTLKLVRDGYRSGNRETRETTRTGEIAYFLNNAVGIIKDNSLVGLWGTQLDITTLKKTEDALRRSESRAQALLDAIPDMIFELKKDGTFLRFIPSATNTPLMPPEEFIGKTVAQVMPMIADQTAFAISRSLESGQLSAFEYELHQNGEPRTFEARFTPAGPDLVLAMVRDVTLRKWAESERERMLDELEFKNAELERFTYTVSHDLKSPLITIKGFLGFVREDTERGNMGRLDTDIQRISDATDKMQNLLNDLLELSRIGRLTNQPETIPMNTLINEVLELLHGRIHSGNITVRVAEKLPAVFGDRQRITEVFQNLIDNAAKFMGDQPKPCIDIGVKGEMDGMPIFMVSDNGIGIASAYKEKIFGLFDKLDARTEGTGIGLAIVKRIVEFQGGRIWVESEPGRGATFFFTLQPGKNPEV